MCGGVPKLQDVSTYPDPAAHRTQQLRLRLGLHVLGDDALNLKVKKAVLHPNYKPYPDLRNDLALLKVLGRVGGVIAAPRPPSPTFRLPLSLTQLSLLVVGA